MAKQWKTIVTRQYLSSNSGHTPSLTLLLPPPPRHPPNSLAALTHIHTHTQQYNYFGLVWQMLNFPLQPSPLIPIIIVGVVVAEYQRLPTRQTYTPSFYVSDSFFSCSTFPLSQHTHVFILLKECNSLFRVTLFCF